MKFGMKILYINMCKENRNDVIEAYYSLRESVYSIPMTWWEQANVFFERFRT